MTECPGNNALQTGVILPYKGKSGSKQVLALVQLLNNFIRSSGPFLSSGLLAFTFMFITPWLQDDCSHIQISLSYSRSEGVLRCQPFMQKAKPFQILPSRLLACHCHMGTASWKEAWKSRRQDCHDWLRLGVGKLSLTGQIVNISDFAGLMDSVGTSQFCHSSTKGHKQCISV